MDPQVVSTVRAPTEGYRWIYLRVSHASDADNHLLNRAPGRNVRTPPHVSLQQITYTDQTGKTRLWEAAERTTRPAHGVDGVAVYSRVHSKGKPVEVVLVKQFRPPVGKASVSSGGPFSIPGSPSRPLLAVHDRAARGSDGCRGHPSRGDGPPGAQGGVRLRRRVQGPCCCDPCPARSGSWNILVRRCGHVHFPRDLLGPGHDVGLHVLRHRRGRLRGAKEPEPGGPAGRGASPRGSGGTADPSCMTIPPWNRGSLSRPFGCPRTGCWRS